MEDVIDAFHSCTAEALLASSTAAWLRERIHSGVLSLHTLLRIAGLLKLFERIKNGFI